jgi:multidrug efflux pump
MPKFFIERPVFAWVIAAFILLLGALALPRLAVERFPAIAPPTITITAVYPGASPQTMNDGVVSLIERQLSSVKRVLYFESSSDTSGSATITVTFQPGTDPELAQVDVQNRIKAIEPRLPQAVRQNGLTIESAGSSFLMVVMLTSKGAADLTVLSDTMSRQVLEELKRVPGVGRAQLFGAEPAMRVWVDPAKLVAYQLTMADVSDAIAAQNAPIAPGRVGESPTVEGQRVSVPLTAGGQLETVEQFAAVMLRANADGSRVTLADVARLELGLQSHALSARESGQPAVAAAILLAPGANALATARGIKARLHELAATLPPDMHAGVPFDTTPFVQVSIEKVVKTLFEAMALVFVVMLLFLQNLRYALIPALVVPIALMGTFAVMLAAGVSVNVLTMFGMVLAIGIIVDDAIVVVEGVERIMAREGLPPKAATVRAMQELTGAVVGITLVLTAVFIPMAFASGSVGAIYRQFSLAMAVSILLSAFLALTLTPALCATLLRPVAAHPHGPQRGFFGAFNRGFDRLTLRYGGAVGGLTRRIGRTMLVYLALVLALGFALRALPSAFLPDEDQGYFISSVQLPAEATAERTLDVVRAYERHALSRPAVRSTDVVLGFSFSGAGSNAALIFTNLKDWNERDTTVQDEVAAADAAMAQRVEGQVMNLVPPSVDNLGNAAGFSLRLIDRANRGADALNAAQGQLLGLAAENPKLGLVYPEGLPPGSTVRLDIDRAKADALGVPFTSISDTLSVAMGSRYVNDFPNRGRMQQVILQAEAGHRMQVDDVLRLHVRSSSGRLVTLSELVRPVWTTQPVQLVRYQGYPAARIAGMAAPGVSSGVAMAEMERLAAQLPAGYTLEWTGQSLQERQSGDQAPMLLALSILVVFLVLAALYESWSIPAAVLLVVPLGLLGAVAAVSLRGLTNDVFFKVGMITVIGLSAKNAILIVEFARQLQGEGLGLRQAVTEAAKLRLRPIVMTSMAFVLGVVPLMLASGAAAETQRAIGTGVFGGMVSATVLAVVFVPVFYVLVQRFVLRWRRPKGAASAAEGITR